MFCRRECLSVGNSPQGRINEKSTRKAGKEIKTLPRRPTLIRHESLPSLHLNARCIKCDRVGTVYCKVRCKFCLNNPPKLSNWCKGKCQALSGPRIWCALTFCVVETMNSCKTCCCKNNFERENHARDSPAALGQRYRTANVDWLNSIWSVSSNISNAS